VKVWVVDYEVARGQTVIIAPSRREAEIEAVNGLSLDDMGATIRLCSIKEALCEDDVDPMLRDRCPANRVCGDEVWEYFTNEKGVY